MSTYMLYYEKGYLFMKNFKSKHYTDTVIYSIDMIIKSLKSELKQRVDNLNMGITSEQFVVLDTIYNNESIYQQQLSEILSKDKSNTTRIISVLLEKGLISKDVSKSNNRLVNVLNITKKGKDLVDYYIPPIKDMIREICKNITDEEIDMLHALSNKFQKDLYLPKQN